MSQWPDWCKGIDPKELNPFQGTAKLICDWIKRAVVAETKIVELEADKARLRELLGACEPLCPPEFTALHERVREELSK